MVLDVWFIDHLLLTGTVTVQASKNSGHCNLLEQQCRFGCRLASLLGWAWRFLYGHRLPDQILWGWGWHDWAQCFRADDYDSCSAKPFVIFENADCVSWRCFVVKGILSKQCTFGRKAYTECREKTGSSVLQTKAVAEKHFIYFGLWSGETAEYIGLVLSGTEFLRSWWCSFWFLSFFQVKKQTPRSTYLHHRNQDACPRYWALAYTWLGWQTVHPDTLP